MRIKATKWRFILLFFFLYRAVAGYAGITIDSVHVTKSTCANNGSIIVYAHGGASQLYALTSGPNTRPQQSSNTFLSLPAGTYQILVTDLLNDSARTTAIVTGNYTAPTFNPTFQSPACPNATTGYIIGNPAGTGTRPYNWQLTNLGTNITTSQSSDTFNNLPQGSYRIREYDSCGNFATFSITLQAPSDSFNIYQIVNEVLPCDTVKLNITLFVQNGHYAPPYTIKVQTHNGTYQHTITDLTYSGVNPQFTETVPGVTYGDYINVTITDACGRSVYEANTVSDFHPYLNFNAVSDSCQLLYIGYFYLVKDSSQNNTVNPTYFPDPVKVIVSTTSGVVIDTIVNNDSINHSSQYAYTGTLQGNHDYKITIIDACGHTHTDTYAWPTTPAPTTNVQIVASSCLDSTTCVKITWQNTFFTLPTFQLLSGPNHIGSTKLHYTYHDTIIYPQQYQTIGATNGYFIELTNLAVGTYHYRVTDSCGNVLIDSFTIRPQDLNIDNFTVNYKKGCPGQNVISVKTDNFSSSQLSGTLLGTINLTIPTDTVINLNYGTYIATFTYGQPFYAVAVNHHPICQIVNDTVVIPPYVPPAVLYNTQIKCHGTMYVLFQPDSTTGVPPYKYEILSGPQVTGVQTSNTFTLSLPGTYVARVTDSCGYASTYAFTVDTLAFAQVVRAGASCVGYSTYLIGQHSPYATYVWQRPNGTYYTGDSLYINPITVADFGTYHIKKIVNVNSCRDTFFGTYIFAGDTITQTYASVCPGQSIVFAGIARTAAGTYYDTLHTLTCDSVVALNLTIKGPVYDSVSQTICVGRSVTVGTHTYTAAGIYRDTFITVAGCDSIHILNLQITNFGHGAFSTVICPGSSYLFGGIARTAAGTYYDTVATAGCDSIITLNLSIRGPLYDSVSQTICQGQSATAGIHTYTVTGIYRDTIVTGGCDSIHVLNLHVTPYSRSTVAAIICPGQSYIFGGITHTAAGTYYDTIPTAGCDSIVTLTLSIRGPLYDSVSQTICAGQNITVNTHTYTATGIYRDTILTGGCDSIHVLNLHVTPYGRGIVAATICPGQSYNFGTAALTATGTYHDTLTTTGCDSIVTLTLTVRGPLYDSVAQTICQGQSITINMHTYNATGLYRDTIATGGCDSIHVLNLTVTPYKQAAITTVICPGQTFAFGAYTLSTAGVYRDTVTTTGCDSITTLTLIIRGPLYDSVSQTICAGQSVTVNTHTYNSTGLYRDTIATGSCDSIHVLNLHVTPYSRSTVAAIICPGQNYIFGGIPRTAAGTYYDTIPTAGCDSIVTLTLSIRGPLYDSVLQTICAGHSIIVGANTYHTTGIYRDTIPTAGCDSIYVLNLHVTPYSTGTTAVTICPGQSYVFGTSTLTNSGVYYDTVPTTGCDSIITLNLTVRGPLFDSVAQTICAGQSVTSGIHIYTASGLYYDTIATNGCDSVHILNLTVNPYKHGIAAVAICPGQAYIFGANTLTAAGVYYDTVATTGCDSITTLTLTIKGPVYDSVAQNICPGQSVTVGTHTYNTTGIYRDTFVTAGCDSIHILNLTLGTNGRSAYALTICPGQSYVFGSLTLTQAGMYNDTIPTTACDSIVTLTLTIRGPLYDSVSQTICAGNSVTAGTHTYSATGIYRDTIATAGCDSVHVLNLTVTPYVTRSNTVNLCPGQSITVGMHTYNTSGTYIDTVPAVIGCDSVITTRLNIITPATQSINVNGICIAFFNGQSYTTNASVTDTILSSLGCDSIYLTANIHIVPPTDTVINKTVCIYPGQTYTIGGQAYSTPGTYADTIKTVFGGCDSVITNTTLKVITPQYVHRHIDSCYTITLNGIIYTRDTVIKDTLLSVCGLDSVIATDSLHLFEPSVIVVSSLELPIIAGQSTQLSISPSGNYQNIVWGPVYNISDIYSATPTVSPRQDTTYYVTAEDANHCKLTADILITVVGNNEPDFLMPTAFSPNGDGHNDIYRPVIKNGPLEILSFQIYDRWGVKVYDKDDTGIIGWDGTYKNVGQPLSVYIYYITVKITSGDIVRQSGNLTLVR